MPENNEDDRNKPIEDEAIDPNATRVPPREGGFAPVELQKPVEDEEQMYTGHQPAEKHALNVTPPVARGLTPPPPVKE